MGKKWGRGQKVVTYSDAISTMLPLFLKRMSCAAWRGIFESKGDYFNFLENDNPLSLYCSLKEVNNLLDDISFEQVAAF